MSNKQNKCECTPGYEQDECEYHDGDQCVRFGCGTTIQNLPLVDVVDNKQTVVAKFEQILNTQFEPNSEHPLWACIALSSDKDAYINAMQKAYELGKQPQSIEGIVGFVLEWLKKERLLIGVNKDFYQAKITEEYNNGK